LCVGEDSREERVDSHRRNSRVQREINLDALWSRISTKEIDSVLTDDRYFGRRVMTPYLALEISQHGIRNKNGVGVVGNIQQVPHSFFPSGNSVGSE